MKKNHGLTLAVGQRKPGSLSLTCSPASAVSVSGWKGWAGGVSTWRFLQRHKAKHAAIGNGYGYRFASPSGFTNTLPSRYGKDGNAVVPTIIEAVGVEVLKILER